MNVTMFPMGFGESILLHQGNSCLLVDCGSESKYKHEYFKNVVEEIEKYRNRFLLISHFHNDHMNGVKYLYDHFPAGFSRVYLPNIFENGNNALELLIVQHLEDLGAKKKNSDSYQIWQLLLDLIKARNTIKLIERNVDFDGPECQFKALWPIRDNKEATALWNSIRTEVSYVGLPLQQITFIANQIRNAVQWITSNEDRPTIYSKAEEEIRRSLESFHSLRVSYMQLLSANNEESKVIKAKIRRLFKKIRNNDYSIVFHTLDDNKPQILMTGDIKSTIMREIAENSIAPSIPLKEHYEVVKAPHHGTSSCYCDFSVYFNYNRLLISNGETSSSNRGTICIDYLSNSGVQHVYCTNTIRRRCAYMDKNKKYADVCVDCRASSRRISCATSHIPKTKVGWIAKNTLREKFESITDISLVNDLTTVEYCKHHFYIDYPILVTYITDETKRRYYAKPLTIMGVEYYLCNDWYERNRYPLLKWMDEIEKPQEDEQE